MPPKPKLIAHADWSTSPQKRWVSLAVLRNGVYVLHAPTGVGPLPQYFPHLLQLAGDGGTVLAGFDFPIGVPLRYAQLAGITAFMPALAQFGHGLWGGFYDLAATPAQIGIHRPFYPRASGGTLQAHLYQALGCLSIDQLRRQCELRNAQRGPACSLFWTLGGNQVGRAAISGWRDLLAPAVGASGAQVAVWPFDGHWQQLLGTHRIVAVETYPKDQYAHLHFPANKWSKRKPQDRITLAPQIHQWVQQHAGSVVLTPALDAAIGHGFGPRSDGEDPFDAVVGLLAMLSVVLGDRPDGAPVAPAVQKIEGWIFGQQ